MSLREELLIFRTVIGIVLLIPLVGGLVGAFGGLAGMARLFGADSGMNISPVLRSNFRAICIAFFSWVPLLLWSVASPLERAPVFRIIVGCAFLAGFARLTGWIVEGYPGIVPALLMFIELVMMPAVLLWHSRLLQRIRTES